jgi:hypothetical protein
MGIGGNAYHIVYVVDRSGSMLDTFDEVRMEMLSSISKLNTQQTFHVIFFALGTPQENAPRTLVYASEEYKRQAAAYLKTIQPQGQTDPLPALRRAFEVLKAAPNDRRGKLIYLLTDGDFQSPDNQTVVAEIRRLNADKSISINCILHVRLDKGSKTKGELAPYIAGNKPLPSDLEQKIPGANVLRQIAAENRGRFKFAVADD